MSGYDTAILVQFLIVGLANGLVYSLIALGFTVIFNATRILNFAQGSFVMLGGMITYAAVAFLKLPLPLAALAGIVLPALIGAATYGIVVLPMLRRQATLYIIIIGLFAVHIIAENAALVGIASTGVGFPSFTEWAPISFLGARISWQIVWIALGATLAMGALNLFFLLTPVGKAMRAAAANPVAARLVGIDVHRMALYSFALSGALGGLGGLLITPAQFTSFNVGLPYALKGFAAAMIGGFGNIWGATVGGIIIGVLEAVSVAFISTKYKDAVTFLLLIVILLVRPNGLFGSLVEVEERA